MRRRPSPTRVLCSSTSSSLLAADMNILRGVQPTSAVSGRCQRQRRDPITVDETGEIELGTTLNPTTLSALVNTLTSFNEGKLKLPAPPASATLGVVENIPEDVAVVSIVCDPLTACSNVDLDRGSLDARVTAGAATVRDVHEPLDAGDAEALQGGGHGDQNGTTFRFLTPVGDRDVAAGSCIDLRAARGEHERFGWQVRRLRVRVRSQLPRHRSGVRGRLDNLRPGTLLERLGVRRHDQGSLGGAQDDGDVHQPLEQAAPFSAPARPPGRGSGQDELQFPDAVGDRDVAAGSCIDLVLPEVNTSDSDGKYGVYEYGCGANCLGTDQGFVVASITCDPARCSSTSESVGTTRVGLVAASTTTVTFTNRSSRGTLGLCKAAGTGSRSGRPSGPYAGGQLRRSPPDRASTSCCPR